MRWIVLILCLWSIPVSAEPTMQVWYQGWDYLASVADVKLGSPFRMMVTIKAGDQDISGVDFKYEGLELIFPTIFRLGQEYEHPRVLDLDGDDPSIYRLQLNGCASPCELRKVMSTVYGDFSGELVATHDVVVTIGGIADSAPDPVFYDCAGLAHLAPMGGSDGGWSGNGTVFPDGSVILNPTPMSVLRRRRDELPGCDAIVPVTAPTFSILKSRFAN